MAKTVCIYTKVQRIQNRPVRSGARPMSRMPKSPSSYHVGGKTHKQLWLESKELQRKAIAMT
jgi:hypothetical protein